MKQSVYALLIALSLAGFACSVQAQDAASDEKHRERKGRSLFNRPAKDGPAEQYLYASSLRDTAHLIRAGRQFNALVRSWPDSPEAPAAQAALAEVLEARRRYEAAFEEYQYLVDHYRNLFPFKDVIERQFSIAETVTTARRRVLGLPVFASPERAIPMFEKIVENAPRWERAPEAQFRVGNIHERNRDDDLAAAAYETVMIRYSDSSLAGDAEFRMARCLYRLSESSPNDVGACEEAGMALARYLDSRPGHPGHDQAFECLGRIKKRLADQLYEQARYYDRIAKKPEAARRAYRKLLERFPDAEQSAVARARLKELADDEGKKR